MTQHPDLLTGPEAAAYLRLVDCTDSPEAGVRALQRLVRAGRIHPIGWCKAHLFHRSDLDRFVSEELHSLTGASATASEGKPDHEAANAE